MSTLLYAFQHPELPTDENTVRATTHPLDKEAPPAEMDAPPEFNELETDEDPKKGLTTRTVASDWTDGIQSSPVFSELAKTRPLASDQPTAGTAAAREAAGERGPGTLAYAIGIEPVERDGKAFGNEYFDADPDRTIQETMGQYMTPPEVDKSVVAAAARTGAFAAQDASAAGLYSSFYSARQAGDA